MTSPDSPEAFKQAVARFFELHARAQAAAAALRDLRRNAKASQAEVLEYMRRHGIDECALENARLVRKQTKRTEALKKEHIEGELRRVVGDETRVSDAVANMYNRRITDMHETLSVVKAEDT